MYIECTSEMFCEIIVVCLRSYIYAVRWIVLILSVKLPYKNSNIQQLHLLCISWTRFGLLLLNPHTIIAFTITLSCNKSHWTPQKLLHPKYQQRYWMQLLNLQTCKYLLSIGIDVFYRLIYAVVSIWITRDSIHYLPSFMSNPFKMSKIYFVRRCLVIILLDIFKCISVNRLS